MNSYDEITTQYTLQRFNGEMDSYDKITTQHTLSFADRPIYHLYIEYFART